MLPARTTFTDGATAAVLRLKNRERTMRHSITMPLTVSDIDIPTGRREIDSAAVKRLAESIKKIGLRHPVTVRAKGDRYILVAGRHRIEAFKKLDRGDIPATIFKMTNDEARLWEIAENLHRAELSNIEKAECIEDWRKITNRQASHDVTPSGGKQPTEIGIRKTAEALDVSHETVRRARQIASIDDEAKDAATKVGVTNISDLVEVSKVAPERQTAKVHELAARLKKLKSQKLASEPRRGRDAICDRVREAVVTLSGLPPAHEVAGYFDGADSAIIISERILRAATWFAAFSDKWRGRAILDDGGDEDGDYEVDVSDYIKPATPTELRNSFLVFSNEAKLLAKYEGRIDNEVLASARATASAWSRLVETMEASAKPSRPKVVAV
jgi:ParB/RepB/Spo0J family partition protein